MILIVLGLVVLLALLHELHTSMRAPIRVIEQEHRANLEKARMLTKIPEKDKFDVGDAVTRSQRDSSENRAGPAR